MWYNIIEEIGKEWNLDIRNIKKIKRVHSPFEISVKNSLRKFIYNKMKGLINR